MPKFIDTRGKSRLAVGVCARCGIKMSMDDLHPDINYPGLLVCDDDRDAIDPYRLSPRPADVIVMGALRPDTPFYQTGGQYPFGSLLEVLTPVLTVDGVQPIASNPGAGELAIAPPITSLSKVVPWQANTYYALGAQVTPGANVGYVAVGQPIYQFVAVVPGASGATAPTWPSQIGIDVGDSQILWVCEGIYLP